MADDGAAATAGGSGSVDGSRRRWTIAGAAVAAAVIVLAAVVASAASNRPDDRGPADVQPAAQGSGEPSPVVPTPVAESGQGAPPVAESALPPPVGPEDGYVIEPWTEPPNPPPPTPFAGSEKVLPVLDAATRAAIAEHVTNPVLRPVGSCSTLEGRREVSCGFDVDGTVSNRVGAFEPGIHLLIRRNGTRIDLGEYTRPWLGGLYPGQLRESVLADGSHLRVYEGYDIGSGERYINTLSVVHVRTDGTVVAASTSTLGGPTPPPFAFSAATLEALATDPRLTF